MALLAGQSAVPAIQRKARQGMVEGCVAPSGRRMARATVAPILAAVFIDPGVAGIAVGRCAFILAV